MATTNIGDKMPRAAYKFLPEVEEVIDSAVNGVLAELASLTTSDKDYKKAVRRTAYDLLNAVKDVKSFDSSGPDTEPTTDEDN